MDCDLVLEETLDEGPENIQADWGDRHAYNHDDRPLFDIYCYFDCDNDDNAGVDWYLNEVQTDLKGAWSIGIVLVTDCVYCQDEADGTLEDA